MKKISVKGNFILLVSLLGVFILPFSIVLISIAKKNYDGSFLSNLFMLIPIVGLIYFSILIFSWTYYTLRLKNTDADYLIIDEKFISIPNVSLRYFALLSLIQPSYFCAYKDKGISIEIKRYQKYDYYLITFVVENRRIVLPSKNLPVSLEEITKTLSDYHYSVSLVDV